MGRCHSRRSTDTIAPPKGQVRHAPLDSDLGLAGYSRQSVHQHPPTAKGKIHSSRYGSQGCRTRRQPLNCERYQVILRQHPLLLGSCLLGRAQKGISLKNPLREISTAQFANRGELPASHGGLKRARSWKRRIRLKNTSSTPRLRYSGEITLPVSGTSSTFRAASCINPRMAK